MGCEEDHQCWREKSESPCSCDLLQAILRIFSQWPSGIFKIPDMLQWHIFVTDSRVIEEIRKAPEHVLSFMDALNEVSNFCLCPRRSTNENVSRDFQWNTLSESTCTRIHIISLLSEHNSPGLFRNSCRRFMKKLSMLSTNLYP
jgi:hypothetical protein